MAPFELPRATSMVKRKSRWRFCKRHRLEDGIPEEEEEKPRNQIIQQDLRRRNINRYFYKPPYTALIRFIDNIDQPWKCCHAAISRRRPPISIATFTLIVRMIPLRPDIREDVQHRTPMRHAAAERTIGSGRRDVCDKGHKKAAQTMVKFALAK